MTNLERLKPEQLYAAQAPLWTRGGEFSGVGAGWHLGDIPSLSSGNEVMTQVIFERPDNEDGVIGDKEAIGLVASEFSGTAQTEWVSPEEYDVQEFLAKQQEALDSAYGHVSKELGSLAARIQIETLRSNARINRLYTQLARRVTALAQARNDLFIIGGPRRLGAYDDTLVTRRKETDEFGIRFAGAQLITNVRSVLEPRLEPLVRTEAGQTGLLPEGYGNARLFELSKDMLNSSHKKKYFTFQPLDRWTEEEIALAKAEGATLDDEYIWMPKPYREGAYTQLVVEQA